MSLQEKLGGLVARLKSERPRDPLIDAGGVIGAPLDRVDGHAKVTGAALFVGDQASPDLAYGAVVYSTIAKGRIARLDALDAATAPGVVVVMTHSNAPRMAQPEIAEESGGAAASSLPVMQSDHISWNGEPVAVVVAETQAQADAAAALIRIEYAPAQAATSFDAHKAAAHAPADIAGEPTEVSEGDPEAALAASEFRVDATYRTPRYNQNAIEPHTTIAAWTGDDQLDLHDTTQSLSLTRTTLAKVFGIEPAGVRVRAAFVGGGFGGKGMVWSPTILAAAAARLAKRPVKIEVSREGVFRTVGGRTCSEQRVALGAQGIGMLRAIIHTGSTAVVTHNAFPEQFSFPARHLYSAATYRIGQTVVPLDMVANSAMRAPGESIGTFALESAMDELAYATKVDPILLRKRNEPDRDPTKGTEFSSRHLVAAYQCGADAFGWSQRPAAPRAQRRGAWWVGQGVATAYYPYYLTPGTARLTLRADGTAVIAVAAHEMGMGTATVQRQHASARLGLPMDRIEFQYGDSALPESGTAGGSSQTVSIMSAVIAAQAALIERMLATVPSTSPLAGAKPHQVVARDGGLYRVGPDGGERGAAGAGESYGALVGHAGKAEVEALGAAPSPVETEKYSMHSYGAQFCELRVHAVTGEVRIDRWVGSFDCGRLLNSKTAHSQLRGGIVMGIGMALTEATQFDDRTGRIMNASLAEYHVPVHLDVPAIEILCTELPDPHAPLGAHGVGELGVTGCAAAIANAVFHATGVRVRELPITLDKLL